MSDQEVSTLKMGANRVAKGIGFRVWAPYAKAVSVVGSFNEWDPRANPLTSEGENGRWSAIVDTAKVGDEYRFHLVIEGGEVTRIDPYAREVTSSIGNGIIHNSSDFQWKNDGFAMPTWNELVIYEMHVGTFSRSERNKFQPADLYSVVHRFGHLQKLGINAIQLMPVAEFAGDFSWGYNPAHIFAVEQAYGGPLALKGFVDLAHEHGFAVILDVVYNHFGPSDLDLWRFDGWSENEKGGIYFYNDERSSTPWGDTRPDYGRGEVREYIFDNCMMWLEEYHIDGLRFDATSYIRSADGFEGRDIVEGWTLLQWINEQVSAKYPGRLTIAEDLRNNEWITKSVGAGGAGFGSQWDPNFVHPIRSAVIAPMDESRSMDLVATAISLRYNADVFDRVIYSESHDEVANGRARVPQEIDPMDPKGSFAKKRSALAAGLVFTAPGIPMIFQGQELLEGGWFRDDVPLDWHQAVEFRGIVRLYRDLIRARRNSQSLTKGLCGQGLQIIHVNNAGRVLAFQRWADHGPCDDVMVICNFANQEWSDYEIGFPAPGAWKLRVNTDAKVYSSDFADIGTPEVVATPEPRDGLPCTAKLTIGPYGVLIYSQDAGT